MRLCFLSIAIWIIQFNSFAQTDTTFWFAAPDLQQAHGDRPILLRFSTGATAATVTVSIPANSFFSPITINIAANSSQSLDLTPYINVIENSVVNVVENRGLKISSTAMVSCYYDIAHGYNGDIYALKGANGLGFKFTLPFQMAFIGAGLPSYTCTFSIVASEDNTVVTITPKYDLLGHPAGVPFNITLNKGQTYTCQASSDVPSQRPGGSVVIANKPIAISTKDDTIRYPGQGCGDTAGDQLIPDCNAGSSFVIPRGQLNGPDYYYVFAISNNTAVSVNGTVVSTINAGEFYMGTLSNPSCYVQTTSPVHVFHLSGFGCELGGAVVPSIDNEGSSFIGLTRASASPFYINVLSVPANIGAFTVNASSAVVQSADFSAVPGTNGNWMVARVPINTAVANAGQNIRIQNSIGKFHIGMIHGDVSSTTRYGYFSDFERVNINLSQYDTLYCKGSNIDITASATGAADFQWTGPNGFSSTGPLLQLTNFQSAQQGYYTVSATTSRCGYVERKVWVGLQTPAADFINPASQCLNENNFQFTSSSTVNTGSIISQTWDFGDGVISSASPVSHQYATAGNYTVKLLVQSNKLCKDSIEHIITVRPSPVASVAISATAACLRNNSFAFNGTATVTPGTIASHLWNFNDGNTANTASSNHSFAAAGSYNVSYIVSTDQNCLDTVQQTIVVHPQPQASFPSIAAQCLLGNSFSFNGAGTINGGVINQYAWNFGDGNTSLASTATHSYASVGNFLVTFIVTSNQNCADTLQRTATVNANPSTTILPNGPLAYCADRSLTLNSSNLAGSGTLTQYQWYLNGAPVTGATSTSWVVAQSGNYTLEVRNSNGCQKLSDPISVIIHPLPTGNLLLPATTKICEGGTVSLNANGGDTYQWLLNSVPITGATGATFAANQPGAYSVELITPQGCRNLATGSVTLTLLRKPIADFTQDAKCAWVLTPFTNLSTVNASGNVTWEWNFGDGGTSILPSPTHTYQQAGNYPVQLKAIPVDCPNLISAVVKNVQIEERRADVRYPIVNAVRDQPVRLQARNFGTEYSWSPGTGLSSTTIANPVFRHDQSLEYLITIRTSASCETVDTQQVRVFKSIDILLPNAFTPNNDGLNDKLEFFLIGIEQFKYLRIFNRWGQLVFETNNEKSFWTGTKNGTLQPSDVYVWLGEGIGIDGSKVFRKGLVTLIRK